MVENGIRGEICHAMYRHAKANSKCLRNYDKDIESSYLKVDFKYPKNLFNLLKDLAFSAEKKKIEKCKKLVCSIHEKENYVVHISALKEALNHGLILRKVHKVV